jgi:hypothetical protein
MSLVIDAFSFYNELDLLELRLNELSSVVDFFILVEATKTHSGLDKPLYYWNNRNRFKKFHHKLYEIVVQDMPITPGEIRAALSDKDRKWIESGYQKEDSWVRERFQRNAIMRALGVDVYGQPFADFDDVIVIEDADEMVRPEVLASIRETMAEGNNAVEQTLHTYYMNWRCTNMSWAGSKIIRYKDMFGQTPSEIRFHTPSNKHFLNGGWHFNYLGGADAIKDKLKAFAHQEFCTNTVFDRIDPLLSERKDALGRLYQYETVPVDETYPKYVQEHPEIFAKYMYGG